MSKSTSTDKPQNSCKRALFMIQTNIILLRNLRRAVAVAAALLLTSDIVPASTLYIKTTGNDSQSGTSWTLAKQTIPGAIAAAGARAPPLVARGHFKPPPPL